jgi:hypothetical protein
MTANASPAIVVWRAAAIAGSSRLCSKVRVADASAAVLWSTLTTDRAPPAAAYREKAPVYENTSNTRAPRAIVRTRARLSRWSRK